MVLRIYEVWQNCCFYQLATADIETTGKNDKSIEANTAKRLNMKNSKGTVVILSVRNGL